MTFPEFDKFFDDFIQECRGMRDTKGKEYANGTSRFGNFDRLAKTLEMDRLKIAQVYVQKHLDSLNSYIKTGEVYSQERIRGRIIDIVTYMILMAGMIEDTDSPALNYGANSVISKLSNQGKYPLGATYRYSGVNWAEYSHLRFILTELSTTSGIFKDSISNMRHTFSLNDVELVSVTQRTDGTINIEPIPEWKPKVGDKVVYMGPTKAFINTNEVCVVMGGWNAYKVQCTRTMGTLVILDIDFLRPVNAAQH